MQPRFHPGPYMLRLILPLGLILLAVGLLLSTHRLDAYNRSPYPLTTAPVFDERATLPTESTNLLDRARIPMEFKLLRGETVTQVFEKLGLESVEARKASSTLAEHLNLRRLRAGNHYSAFFNPDASLASFEITLDGSGRFEMTRTGSEWETDWQPFQRTVEPRVLRGSVDGSLESSIRRAGGPSGLAYRLADVLQWDLDFSRDLQRGDRFEVLYEEILLDGEYHAIGNVLALSYQGKERLHEAFRYGDDGTYYDTEGRPLKKRFLRSPLRYSRITSRFSTRRFHPVLKIYRPHYGVDYGAPVGTPVQVTGNGVVVSAGWDRGGGNVVRVRHGNDYETAYLHLSRFASGIRRGARVRQGDIIAYTGATGLASGPHLDYRVKYRERWIDPMSLKGVRDEPIPQHKLASYRNWSNELRVSLRTGVIPKGPLAPWTGGQQGETRLAVRDARPGQERLGQSAPVAR
jgi:murein DD-endopeptidase MepM/ murein hydrolase activator NlpD